MRNPIYILFTTMVFIFGAQVGNAQNSTFLQGTRPELIKLVEAFDAKVGLAVLHIETGDTLTINNEFQFPMQSVYKFPLAIAVLKQVDEGKLLLDQKIHISKEQLHENTWSPLAKSNPEGNIDLTIASLLEYTVSQSDNNTCDILFELVNGPEAVQKHFHELGYNKLVIQTTEAQMAKEGASGQDKNWCQPLEMTKLLRDFYNGKLLSESSTDFLMKLMIESSNSAKRLKGLLPETVVTAHKTGTGNKVVNDVGIITLPDGNHVAMAVFVCQSNEEFSATETFIAKLTELVYYDL